MRPSRSGAPGFAFALSASLGLARRGAEQRLLQFLDALGKPGPVAGEGMLRAAHGLRPLDVARRRRWLAGTPRRHGRPLGFMLHGSLQLLLLLLLLQLLLLLLRRERRRDAAPPLIVEIGGVLFVDLPLLLGRRIRPRDIEIPVLHEIEITIAAA